MALFSLTIGIILVMWLVTKGLTNTEPDQEEGEEAARKHGKAKHQFWQTMDWTEPWNDR